MPALKSLTVEAIDALKPAAARREIKDAKVPGLRIVVQPTGAKSWAFRYVVAGRDKKLTLGTYPELTLLEARQRASAARGDVLQGRDPASDKVAARRSANTVRAVWEEYRDLHMAQRAGSTADAAATLFNNTVLPKWGDLGIETIRRRDVMNLLDGMRNEPAKANKAKVRLHHFFGWAVEREIIEASPVANIKTPNRLKSRTRVLSDAELRVIWNACDEVGVFGHVVRLLVLTMARRNEVAHMRWDELSDILFTIPETRTKNGIALDLHRSDAFNNVLASVPVIGNGSEYVFEGRHHGKPIGGFSDLKMKLDEVLGDSVKPWRLHDLRRTGGTIMQRLGIRKEVIDAAQNHKMAGISATYLRYGYASEKLQAFNALAAEVARIVSGVEASNAVPLVPVMAASVNDGAMAGLV